MHEVSEAKLTLLVWQYVLLREQSKGALRSCPGIVDFSYEGYASSESSCSTCSQPLPPLVPPEPPNLSAHRSRTKARGALSNTLSISSNFTLLTSRTNDQHRTHAAMFKAAYSSNVGSSPNPFSNAGKVRLSMVAHVEAVEMAKLMPTSRTLGGYISAEYATGTGPMPGL